MTKNILLWPSFGETNEWLEQVLFQLNLKSPLKIVRNYIKEMIFHEDNARSHAFLMRQKWLYSLHLPVILPQAHYLFFVFNEYFNEKQNQ